MSSQVLVAPSHKLPICGVPLPPNSWKKDQKGKKVCFISRPTVAFMAVLLFFFFFFGNVRSYYPIPHELLYSLFSLYVPVVLPVVEVGSAQNVHVHANWLKAKMLCNAADACSTLLSPLAHPRLFTAAHRLVYCRHGLTPPTRTPKMLQVEGRVLK